MIKKPDAAWGRDDDRLVETAREFGSAASRTLRTASSGVARVRAGYSAVVSAFTAVISGTAALAAGGLGGNVPMAMLAGSFSLLLGGLALWNFRKAFGGAPSSRAAPDWELDGRAPDGLREAGRAADWASPADDGWPAADSTTIRYDRTKIFLRAAWVFLTCAAMAAALTRVMHNAPVFSLLVLLALGFGVWRIFGLLFTAASTDLTAIAWNNHRIRVRTLTSSCQVPWAALESVVVKRETLRLLRLIPISTSYTLMFRLRQNGSPRKMNVPASVLTIPSRDAMDVMRKIEICRARYARNPMAGGTQRNAERGQTPDRSFRGAHETDAASFAGPARRTQGFETAEPITAAPVAFGRKSIG